VEPPSFGKFTSHMLKGRSKGGSSPNFSRQMSQGSGTSKRELTGKGNGSSQRRGGGESDSSTGGNNTEGSTPSTSKTSKTSGKLSNRFGRGLLLQDTLTPLLLEVDTLYEKSKEIIAAVTQDGKRLIDEEMEVEIMERIANAWQAIESKNARHETSHKQNRDKPMFCMDSLGKRIKAALLCKLLPEGDNPAAYVNGPENAPSRNLVTAIKLAAYVVHCGTGGKVSAVDGDGREPPSKYTKEEFLSNVLPRASAEQPSRVLMELRQLACRLVASGVAKGLIGEGDLPEIREVLIERFEDGAMHFLGGGDAAFARFMGVASNAHRLLDRGEVDGFVVFHERVVKLVGMCRNRVRRAAYATSKNMLTQVESTAESKKHSHHTRKTRDHARPGRSTPVPVTPLGPNMPQRAHALMTPSQPDVASITSVRSLSEDPGLSTVSVSNMTGGRGIGSGVMNNGGMGKAPHHSGIIGVGGTSNDSQRFSGGGPGGTGNTSGSFSYVDNLEGGNSGKGGDPMVPIVAQNIPFTTSFPAHGPPMMNPGYGHPPTMAVGNRWEGQYSSSENRQMPQGMPVDGGGRERSMGTVLVTQPGWFVTLPRNFPGTTDTKRQRVPVKVLWELEAESIPNNPHCVHVEMRPAPGYMDFFAKLIPPEMLKFRWPLRRWETLQSAGDSRCALEEAAAAADSAGLVPVPPSSALRHVYDELKERAGIIPPQASFCPPENNYAVPPVAAAVLRDTSGI
ncbi:unnamed protein product, partial [Choristocarpus tenellus]